MLNATCWAAAVAANACLLLFLALRRDGIYIVKRAVFVLISTPVIVLLIALILRSVGARPSPQFTVYIFAAFFTIVIMAMINIANVVFRGMVDAVIAFHEQHNASNLDRFPISALVRHRDHLKTFASIVWCLGSALMLYGVWFDMAVVG